MTGALVAGVDSSTQSCKVELRDLSSGALVGTGSAEHPPVQPPVSEQDPEDWWQAFVTAFRRAVDDAGSGASPGSGSGVDVPARSITAISIAAISVAAQCHGLVGLDATDRIIRPAKLWNDTTSSTEMRRLRSLIGERDLIERTGSLPTAAFTISKLAWLADHEPESYARLRTVLLPHDYLTFRLTGNKVTDRSEASGTGYFDARAGRYLLDYLGLIDSNRDWAPLLPSVLAPNTAAGNVRPEAARELGIQTSALVGAGGGDQHASALGLGVQPGDVVYSLGTSGVVFGLSRDSVHDAAGRVDGVCDMTGGYLPLVSTLNAARVTDTFARLLGVDHAELSRLALTAGLSAPGPTFAAFLDGERTPDRPSARGTLTGITTATSRQELARSVYEGVLLGLVNGQRQLESCGVAVNGRVIAIGGGARSEAYTQLLADILHRPILTADVPQAAARGAAVQAAAVARGATVADMCCEWMPKTRVASKPRDSDRDPLAEYTLVAEYEGFDIPGSRQR